MGIVGYWLEIVSHVERCGAVVDGIDDNEAAPSGARGAQDRGESLYEQFRAQTFAMQAAVEGEFGEKDRRNPARRAAPDASRRLFAFDEEGGDGEVADDGVRGVLDEHVRTGPLPGRMATMLLEPIAEAGIATIE